MDVIRISRKGSSMVVGRHIATRSPMNWVTRKTLHSAENRFQAPENRNATVVSLNPVQTVVRCLDFLSAECKFLLETRDL